MPSLDPLPRHARHARHTAPRWRAVLWSAVRVYVVVGFVLWVAQDLLLFPGVVITNLPGAVQPPKAPWSRVEPAGGPMMIAAPRTTDRLVLMVHGNGEAAAPLAVYGEVLALMDWDFAAMEFRGYAGADGWPSADRLAADVNAAIAWAEAQGWPRDRIVVHGRSIGGGVAVRGAVDAGIAGFVLESTFDDLGAVASTRFPVSLYPVRWLLRHDLDSASTLTASPAPVFQVHDRTDAVVPLARGEGLRDAVGTDWYLTEGYPHGTPIVLVDGEARRAWLAWLDALVPPSPEVVDAGRR